MIYVCTADGKEVARVDSADCEGGNDEAWARTQATAHDYTHAHYEVRNGETGELEMASPPGVT